MGNASDKEKKPLRTHEEDETIARSALVLGATGATGIPLVQQLLCSPKWNKVTIVHRRELKVEEISQVTGVTLTDSQLSKLRQHVIDMENIGSDEHIEKFAGHDVVFCVLGTTRATAKSAENFRKVDLYMVRDSAQIAKKAGVSHYSLCTSAGASSGYWANNWKVSHGLLYLQVKGLAEAAVVNEKFRRTSIFRPGVLNRTPGSNDTKAMKLIPILPVHDLAAVMIYDAETSFDFEEKDIQKSKPDSKPDSKPVSNSNNEVNEANEVENDDGKLDVKDHKLKDENKNENGDENEHKDNQNIVEPALIYETTHIDILLPLAQANRTQYLTKTGVGNKLEQVEEEAEPLKGDSKVESNTNTNTNNDD